MGYAYDGLANYGQAIAHYEQAVDIYRDIGDSEGQASSLISLGDTQLTAGLPARARLSWEQALAVLTRIPGVDTSDVRSRLAQLDDAAGVGERRVEHRHAALGRRGEVDLVRPDAERADGEQVRGGREDPPGDVRLRSDAEETDALERLDELFLAERAWHRAHFVAGLRQSRRRVRMDVLQ